MKFKHLVVAIFQLFLSAYASAGPIELVSFSGTEASGFIELNWQTRTEHDLKVLSLEKSHDAIEFFNVADFHSDPTNSGEKSYQFKDESPYSGINYYRLKQTDKWGNVKYFKTIAVNYTRFIDAVVYPNPIVNKEFKMRLNRYSEIVLNISNSNGRTVFSQTFPASETNDLISVSLPQLEEGTYVFIFYLNETVSTRRVFIRD